ncbi:MAG: bifunctional tetrahydrofolate synthase/dihydrofolate synthase [Pseudomonadales bacterium]|nr:bifunctional tetrahydrofolate synthase/dihydrofolate synthase [Pseudomonadales bacterium]
MKTGRSLNGWLVYLETLHPAEIELGLDRVRRVAENAGVLSQEPFIVTVAGTNGKGTTIAALESVLLKAGLRVGVFTSPHLFRYNERVRINGQMVSDQPLCDSFSEIDKVRDNIPITYFEFSTLSALWLFARQALDIILLEVGLGGRLDAVNIVDPDVSVLTSIGIDHTDWLGSTIDAIAREKVAIGRKGKPFVCGADNLPDTVSDELMSVVSPFVCRPQFGLRTVSDSSIISDSSKPRWVWQGVSEQGEFVAINDLPSTKIPLVNAALALQVLQFLPFKISEQAVLEGIGTVSVPGRLQWVDFNDTSIIVDVAHNEQAATYLAAQLAKIRLKYNKVIALYSALQDKDSVAVVKALRGVIDRWIVAPLDTPRGSTLEDLKASLVLNQVDDAQYFATVRAALLHLSLINDQKTLIIVFGSFYTVAEALQFYGCTD